MLQSNTPRRNRSVFSVEGGVVVEAELYTKVFHKCMFRSNLVVDSNRGKRIPLQDES